MLRAIDRRTRRGSVAVYALVSLPVLLAIFAGVVRVAFLRLDKTDLQTACDAAALAAVNVLADTDALLSDDPHALPAALALGREAAVDAAGRNLVRGRPVAVMPEGVEFGRAAPGQPFEPIPEGHGSALRQVNAVRVTASVAVGKGRDPLVVRAVAFLDFDAVGVQPVADRPVPLVPIAVQFHPGAPHPHALESQPRCDRHRPRHEGKGWVKGRDGVDEFAVVLGPRLDRERGASAWLLRFGGGSPADQIAGGVTAAELSAWPTGFRLDAKGPLVVPAFPRAGAGDPDGFARTVAALHRLKDEAAPRLWPTGRSLPGGGVAVTGFFGARVAAVEADRGAKRVRLVLQPAVLATPTAVTAPGGSPLPTPFNLTACRPRLAE